MIDAKPSAPAIVPLDAIRAAADRIRADVRATPLVPGSSDMAWRHVWLKCENLQVSGAFKARGAFNFLAQLPAEIRARGVVTYSSGNHGQAMSLAAQRFGVPAVVVMPTTAPPIKIEGARSFGAEVFFAGTTSNERRALAEQIQRERNLTMVPPFDHEAIIAGQGTVGLEILEQRPDARAVFVPLGGGGLLAGVAAAVKQSARAVRIVGVEPEGAAKMTASLSAGHPVTLERVASLADGLIPVRPGDLTFAHTRALVDEVVTVSDAEIAGAVRWIARHGKMLVEPSGAAGVAAILRLGPAPAQTRIGPYVAVLSGGNVQLEQLAGILAES
jgi:threonine dehydratase